MAFLGLGILGARQENNSEQVAAARKLGEQHVAESRRKEWPSPLDRTELDSIDAHARVRLADIRAELPDAPEWAGVYSHGNGLGMNVALWVAPRAGAVYFWHGCLGLYDVNHGDIVEVERDRIRIELVIDPERNLPRYDVALPRRGMSREWLFVTWGDTRYLIPSSRMISFCNEVNGGNPALFQFPSNCREPRLLFEPECQPAGTPTVPYEYRPFLLPQPLSGEIVTAGEPQRVGELFLDGLYQVVARVDLGSEDGLLPAMVLHVIEEEGRGEGEVVEVAPKSCVVEFRFPIRDEHLDVPQAGWRVSTRKRGR